MDHRDRAVSGPDPDRPAPPERRRAAPARTRRGRGQRGAVLVEAAIILPVLMLVVLGIVEYALAFKNSLTVTSATRAGARVASAQPRQSNFATNTAQAVGTALTAIDNQSPQELWIYKANPATGLPDSGNFTSCSQCVRYSWNTATQSWNTASPLQNNWNPATQNACPGTADEVGIYIRATHHFLTGLFGQARTLQDHTVMRLEPIPTSQQCAP